MPFPLLQLDRLFGEDSTTTYDGQDQNSHAPLLSAKNTIPPLQYARWSAPQKPTRPALTLRRLGDGGLHLARQLDPRTREHALRRRHPESLNGAPPVSSEPPLQPPSPVAATTAAAAANVRLVLQRAERRAQPLDDACPFD